MWLPLTSRVGLGLFRPDHALDDVGHPGAGGVDQRPRRDLEPRPVALVLERQPPFAALPPGGDEAGAGGDLGAAVGGVARVERDQPRIVDPAVRIFEGAAILGLERLAGLVLPEVEALRRRQDAPPAEVVVEKEAEPDDRPRPQAAVMREDKSQRPDDVRGGARAAPRARAALRAPAGTRRTRDSASPPWMSLVEAEDVAPARSPISPRKTLRPRPWASRAMPQPFTPPPITARSYVRPDRIFLPFPTVAGFRFIALRKDRSRSYRNAKGMRAHSETHEKHKRK